MAEEKIRVALLAIPEVAASTLYGMYDIFAAAGRDWPYLIEGVPGRQPLVPLVVSGSGPKEMRIANGVRITPMQYRRRFGGLRKALMQ